MNVGRHRTESAEGQVASAQLLWRVLVTDRPGKWPFKSQAGNVALRVWG